MTKRFQHKIGFYLFDFSMLFFVLLVAIKVTSNLEDFLDLSMYDEPNYLMKGKLGIFVSLDNIETGALYSFWYWILAHFQTDEILLYYLNQKLVVILFCGLLYLLGRRYGISPCLAIFPPLLQLATRMPEENIKVSVFSAIVVFCFLIIGSFCRNRIFLWIISLSAAATGTLCRPEYALSFVFLLSWGILIFWKARSGADTWKEFIHKRIKILAAIFLIAMLLIGHKLNHGRANLAFGMGFSNNYAKWHKIEENSYKNYKTNMAEAFANPYSISGALRSNPKYFLMHCLENSSNYIGSGLNGILPSLVPNLNKKNNFICKSFFLVVYLALIIFALKERRKLLEHFKGKSETIPYLFLLSMAVVLIAPIVFSSIVIFHLERYLALQNSIVLIFLFLLANYLYNKVTLNSKFFRGAFTVAAVLFSYTIPSLQQKHISSDRSEHTIAFKNRKIVEKIRSMEFNERISLLDAGGGVCFYTTANCSSVPEYDKQQNEMFKDFLIRRNLGGILVSPELLESDRFRDDKSWLVFLENPAKENFKRVELNLSGINQYLLLKSPA